MHCLLSQFYGWKCLHHGIRCTIEKRRCHIYHFIHWLSQQKVQPRKRKLLWEWTHRWIGQILRCNGILWCQDTTLGGLFWCVGLIKIRWPEVWGYHLLLPGYTVLHCYSFSELCFPLQPPVARWEELSPFKLKWSPNLFSPSSIVKYYNWRLYK